MKVEQSANASTPGTRMEREDVLRDLPHWARVAFAAHCGRSCVRIFQESWPEASDESLRTLLAAIACAEISAANGVADEAARSKALKACCVAGEALMTAPESRSAIASLAAKPAEFAARAVAAGREQSETPAIQAFHFALNAAWESGAEDIVEDLTIDISRLARASIRGGWTDSTVVPTDIFDLLRS